MATLQARIEDYTGSLTAGLQTSAAQFLEDGCVEISKIAMQLAPNKVHRFTKDTVMAGTANWTLSDSGEVLRATFTTSSGTYDAIEENASLSSQLNDSDSIYYATKTSPKYVFPGNNKIQFYPSAGTGTIITVYQLPDEYSITIGNSSITDFPTDYLVLPVLYSAYKIFHKKMVDLGSSLPTDLDADTTVFDAISDFTSTLDLSSTTDSHLDLTTEFTKLKTFINDEEDVELAQAKIGEISTKLSEVSQELQNKISKISIEEREYAQNLAKNLQLYTTLIQKLNTDYQWLASQYASIKGEYNEKMTKLLGIQQAQA